VTAAGAHVGYAYDAAGRLATVTDSSGTTTLGWSEASLATVTQPGGGQTRYLYDGAGRLVEQYGPGGVFEYGLDADGNRVSVDGPLMSASYTLDADNRLTSSTSNHVTTSYGYDAAGNRTSVSSGGSSTGYSYDAAGRLSKVGSSAVSVDPDGDITTVGGDSYSYNAAGQLVAASAGGASASYTVNADGQRVAVTSGGSTDKLVLDVASDLPAVLAETGHRYTRSTDGTLLADTTATGTTYATTDAQGSVTALTDASQQPVGTATYDPYGVITGTTGMVSSFGYTGAATDVTGNVDLQAREYDPTLGQFLQADTYQVGGPGTIGFNRYTYAGDNPATEIDASGRDFDEEEVVADESIEDTLGGIAEQTFQHEVEQAVETVVQDDAEGMVEAEAEPTEPSDEEVENGKYCQTSYSENFSKGGLFNGMSIDDVAEGLSSGSIVPGDVPVNIVVRDGQVLIANTRSAMALTRAGIPRSRWNIVNQTSDPATQQRVSKQLARNGLTNEGCDL
jgi:RHS repeat-associated protein